MYKMLPNRINHIYFFPKILVWCLLIFLLLLGWSSAVVSIGAMLDNAVQKHVADGTLKKLPGKAWVSSLFKKSLSVVKGRDIQVIDNTLHVSLQEIYSQYPACQQSSYFTKEDLVNILYYTAGYGRLWTTFIPFAGNNAIYLADTSFRRMIDQTIAADTTLKTPTVQQRNASCIKLAQCQSGDTENIVRLTLEIQTWCENTARQLYMDKMLTERSMSLLTAPTFWENVFQNGSLADSDYDLMVDIYNIGRLLFEWYQPPVELIYYQLPSPAQAGGSPQIQQLWTLTPNAMTHISAQASLAPTQMPTQSSFQIWGVTVPEIAIGDMWVDVATLDGLDEMFIDQTNTSTLPSIPIATTQTPIISTDMCVVSWEDPIAVADIPQETISFDEYMMLLEDYFDLLNESQSIQQLISDEIALVPAPYDPNDPDSINIYQDEIADIEQRLMESIWNIFDDIAQSSQEAQSCIADCQWLSTADTAVCVAKCLCGEIGSPALLHNNTEFIQANAFQVRFCQVPASPTSITRWRTIYSIEEIFQEIRNIFVSLRDSWQLIKHVRTKEMLDSSVKRNNFGRMFAFRLFFARKWIQDNTPAVQYQQNLDRTNQRLENALLRQSDNRAASTERNKYVLVDNHAVRGASLETDGSLEDLVNRIATIERHIQQSQQAVSIHPSIDLQQLLEQQKTAIVHEAIAWFFVSNVNFWDTVSEMFIEINGIAEDLSRKIKKAK